MQSVNKTIEDLREDEHALYLYIMSLLKSDPLIHTYEGTFEKLLNDDRDSIKEVAIHALLFHLHSKNVRVRDAALMILADINSDFDLRLASMSGIAITYCGTKNKYLMKQIMHIYKNENESKPIRRSALHNLLLLYGISSRDIVLRSKSIHSDPQAFADELKEIESALTD